MNESPIPYIANMTSHASMGGPLSGSNYTIYLDPKPYPSVEATAPDPTTVALLKDDYAGAKGELTGIIQYLYQNIRSTDNETFANAMLQIAIVEMMHLDMLGDAIQALGGKPSFDDGKYYWQAAKVNYADSMPAMLRANIDAESIAIENYQKHAAETGNEQIRALLLRIADDERLHLRFFEELLAKVEAGTTPP